MKKAIFTLISFVIIQIGISQNSPVTWVPFFATDTDSITVFFDASKGNGALNNIAPPIYAHTGVITNLSTSPSDWKYVKNGWTVNNANAQLIPLGNNLYKIKFHVRNYYGVPLAETILQLAFVFRNATGTTVGRNADGSDIFVPIYPAGLNAKIISPTFQTGKPIIVANGASLQIDGIASSNADLSILLNGANMASATNEDSLSQTISFNQTGLNEVVFTADNGLSTDADTIRVMVNPAQNILPLPPNTKDGITYLNDSTVILNLFAPFKSFVYVLGGFNQWQTDTNYFMNRTPAGDRYWIQINGLAPLQEYVYQYYVDGTITIGDPYCDKIVDPSNDGGINTSTYPNPTPYPIGKTQGIASVLQTAQPSYTWTVTNFTKPANTDLVIYELCIRDFVGPHNYATLLDTIAYLQLLGVNAIELMPVNEFEGNNSWGYNPSYYFAPDKYYGTKNKLKEFVDTCHSRGIAVIFDIVLNHSCGQSPMVQLYWDNNLGAPALNSPWFNQYPKHDFNVCYDFNHESPATKYFVDRVTEYWLTEYKFDGYRFDLAKGFTQKNTVGNLGAWSAYDTNRVATLKNIADHVWSTSPNAYMILEMFADNTEEKELANYGMMVWGNSNNNYNEATMGYLPNSNFNWISYKQRGFNNPHVVGYMESHDEQRLMFKNITYGNSSNATYNIKDTVTAVSRMELAGAFFFTIPGPKMIWQFGEIAYDVSLLYGGSNVAPKPLKWNYYFQGPRKKVYDVWGNLIKLKKNYPAFKTTNFSLQLTGAMKRIHLNDPTMNVTVLGNFDVVSGTMIPNFQSTGWWYEYFTGDSLFVTNVLDPMILDHGEYRLYTSVKLPAFASVSIDELLTTSINEIIAYPNPASESTKIGFLNPKDNFIKIEIFDVKGHLVTNLSSAKISKGYAEFTWNLQNDFGNKVNPGNYFVRLSGDNLQRAVTVIVN